MFRTPSRRRPLVLLFAVALAISTLSIAGAASAYGGETGYILIHGPGTAFAGPDSYNNVTTTAGGTAMYSFEIKNTGSQTAQFDLRLSSGYAVNCGSCANAKIVLTPGTADTVTAAQGLTGYFTPPIAAGKTMTFTMKVTPPAGTPPGTVFDAGPYLDDTTGIAQISEAFADVTVTASTGTAANDEFVTGAGNQKPVAQRGGTFTMVSDPSAKPNATSVFTVKLQNDSAVAGRITYQLYDYSQCGSAFPATVKVGTTDITAAALAGTYQTPVLAKGKFTTLTVTVTAVGTLAQCNNLRNSSLYQSNASNGNAPMQQVYLVTNPVAS